MTSTRDVFALISKRMGKAGPTPSATFVTPSLSDLRHQIDTAIARREAA